MAQSIVAGADRWLARMFRTSSKAAASAISVLAPSCARASIASDAKALSTSWGGKHALMLSTSAYKEKTSDTLALDPADVPKCYTREYKKSDEAKLVAAAIQSMLTWVPVSRGDGSSTFGQMLELPTGKLHEDARPELECYIREYKKSDEAKLVAAAIQSMLNWVPVSRGDGSRTFGQMLELQTGKNVFLFTSSGNRWIIRHVEA